jgi:predicted ATPase
MTGGFTPQAFVGRADELGRLAASLDRAEQEQPQLVLLAGDAGVGKTRLLLEFAERARRRGSRVLVGGCVELGDIGLAYLPVVDALRGLVDDPEEADLVAEVAATAPGLGRLLPEVARSGPPGAGDGLEQLQVFDAVRALLLRRSQRSPVVVVLEDLHWADRASRDLIGFLARTLRSGRVLLVASYRSDELHRRHPLRPLLGELVRLAGVERLELAPFSRAELAEHLEAIAGAPPAADQLVRIFERSEGNPFYAEQLLAAGAGEADAGLPSTLADVLVARVQGLSEPAQQVLGVAAVPGRRVSHRLLAEVAGWPEAELERGLREGSAPVCWWPTAPPGPMRFATRCCRRRSTLTCFQASRCACMPAMPACSPPSPGAPRLSSPTIAWPATTWSVLCGPRLGQLGRLRRPWPRPRRSAT